MTWLKVLAVVMSIVIASLAYILLTRFFPSEEVSFIGSLGSRPLQRALVVDFSVKSDKRYPSFLPENSGFLVIHPNRFSEDHRDDILEARDILNFLKEANKATIQATDPLYPELELLFLKKTALGIRAHYMSLSNLGIKSIVFSPYYLSQFLQLYQDKLPHAAGYAVMVDSSQRLIRDILVR